MTATMNGARKYVVSNTLSEATWENSSVINGDVYASLASLKEDTDFDDWQCDAGPLAARTGLVDELHLLAPHRRRPRQEAVRGRSNVLPLELKSATTFETGCCTWSTRLPPLPDRPIRSGHNGHKPTPKERLCATW